MTKTDWTKEEVRGAAMRVRTQQHTKSLHTETADMLDNLANRIAADESAVPEVTDGMWKIGKLIERLSEIKKRFGDTCVWMEECKWGASALHAKADHDDFEASKAHPPAQTAQEDEGKEQWDELAAILGCDGDNVDLVFCTAKRIMSDRIAPTDEKRVHVEVPESALMDYRRIVLKLPIAEPAQEQPGWKVPDEAVPVGDGTLLPATSIHDWAIRKSHFCIRVVDHRFAAGWNACREAMLAASPTPPKEK